MSETNKKKTNKKDKKELLEDEAVLKTKKTKTVFKKDTLNKDKTSVEDMCERFDGKIIFNFRIICDRENR